MADHSLESLLQINKDGIKTKYQLEWELTEKLCRKCQKCVFQRQPFPLEFRAGLYVFGIRKSCRMGAACKLIKIPTFCFYASPPTPYTNRIKKYRFK